MRVALYCCQVLYPGITSNISYPFRSAPEDRVRRLSRAAALGQTRRARLEIALFSAPILFAELNSLSELP